jgi:predicted RNA-binding Zn-ribbon protein involved in translation (DUF1610 family)
MTNTLIVCKRCGHAAPMAAFRYGRGRHLDEHPEHQICPACGKSITWYGYYTRRTVEAHECNRAA